MPVISILLFCSVSPISADDKAYSAQEIIDSLGWLAGSWYGDFEGKPFETYYTSPDGGVILSVSKEFCQVRRCFVEFEKFEIMDGKVIMTPYPNGRQSVGFTLVDFDPARKRAEFENKEHDFPTDITYERTADDSLVINVAGPIDGIRKVLTVRLSR